MMIGQLRREKTDLIRRLNIWRLCCPDILERKKTISPHIVVLLNCY